NGAGTTAVITAATGRASSGLTCCPCWSGTELPDKPRTSPQRQQGCPCWRCGLVRVSSTGEPLCSEPLVPQALHAVACTGRSILALPEGGGEPVLPVDQVQVAAVPHLAALPVGGGGDRDDAVVGPFGLMDDRRGQPPMRRQPVEPEPPRYAEVPHPRRV